MNQGEGAYLKALAEAERPVPDLETAYTLLSESWRLGNPQAAYALGTWYLHGYYLSIDAKHATHLLRQARNGNVPNACFDLAVCYETGSGVRRNFRCAAEHYLRAALLGDKQAVFEVGRCYWYGIGFERDRRAAKIWFDRAKMLQVYERANTADQGQGGWNDDKPAQTQNSP